MSNQNKQQKPAENVLDAWDMLDVVPLPTNDNRYVDCSQVRDSNVVKKLANKLRVHARKGKYMHTLFTGYRGDGKSTELFRFMDVIKDDYRTFYFNAEQEFDLQDVKFPDFLLGISRVVFARMIKEGLSIPDNLLKQIADWFAQIIEVVDIKSSAELKAEASTGTPKWFQFVTGKLMTTIKTGGEKRKEVRREMDKQLNQLLSHVDKLLSSVVETCKKNDNREPVIIFDNLDRLRPEIALELFHTNGQNLRTLNCHFVFVIPISLLYMNKLAEFENPIIMHLIPVRQKNNQPKQDSLDLLKELLNRRIVPHKIITEPEEIITKFILASGGHLRDLVRMFREACTDALDEPDEMINEKVSQRIINRVCESYQKIIKDDVYPYLIEIYKTKDAGSNDRQQDLIFQTVILEYEEDGKTWSDIHPVLVQGEKFQKLLAES